MAAVQSSWPKQGGLIVHEKAIAYVKPVSGIHHVTVISSDAARTLLFYTKTLRLDLLCRTVNFDEPDVLHLYCGTDIGALLSFFVHDGAVSGRRGTGQVSSVVFAVPEGSLAIWNRRLTSAGVALAGRAWAFGEEYLCFSDPDGLSLALVEERLAGMPKPIRHSTFGIRRIRSIEIQTDGFQHVSRFLLESLGFEAAGREGVVFRFLDGPPERPVAVDLLCSPNHRPGREGAGVAHQVAWHVHDLDALSRQAERLAKAGYDVTPVLDRQYFSAVYFRGPCGLNFSLATGQPGFAKRRTGKARLVLDLPPWLEPRRTEIEKIVGK